MTVFDAKSADRGIVYRLISGTVVPRPIAWVSTLGPGLVPNLAPFSFFTVASRDPACVAISVGESAVGESRVKDTLANIRRLGEFVVNIPDQDMVDAVEVTGRTLLGEGDDFAFAGLGAAPSARVRPSRVEQAKAALECRLLREIPIGTDHLVLGVVEAIYVADECVDELGHVDLAALRPLGRVSGPRYCVEVAANLVSPQQDAVA